MVIKELEDKKPWGGKRSGAGRRKGSKNKALIKEPKERVPRFGKQQEEINIKQELYQNFKNTHTLDCPDDLDRIAKECWAEIMLGYSQLDVDVLNYLDRNQLRIYCQSKSLYVKAWNTWQKQFGGSLVGDDSVEQQGIDKLIKVMDTEKKMMAQLAPDLCLTPTGRAKFAILGAKAYQKRDDDAPSLAEFMKDDDE